MGDTEKDDLLAAPEAHLEGMGERLGEALRVIGEGDAEEGEKLLREILVAEPRLAEPRMELAVLLLDGDDLEEAAAQAKEAVSILEAGGQWVQDVPPNELQSLAHNILGEALRRQADADEVLFGDPRQWRALLDASKAAFERAVSLDPTNEHAGAWKRDFALPSTAGAGADKTKDDANGSS